jgi:hypothetical protein
MSPPVSSKTSPRAQNMKKGPATPGAAENESGSAKHENGSRRPWYRGKRLRELKTSNQELTP